MSNNPIMKAYKQYNGDYQEDFLRELCKDYHDLLCMIFRHMGKRCGLKRLHQIQELIEKGGSYGSEEENKEENSVATKD